MLRSYVYYQIKKAWLEENHLLLHDIAAFLDEEKNTIFLWRGPKSTKSNFKNAYNSIIDLTLNYPDNTFHLEVLKNDIPEYIEKRIDLMLEIVKKQEAEGQFKFTRLITIRFFCIFSLISIILSILLAINLTSCVLWSKNAGNYSVGANSFDEWIYNSQIFIIIILILLGINISLGIIEQEYQIIILNISGFIISIGQLVLLNQGIFLFTFQSGSTLINYLILQKDVNTFLIFNLIAILIYEIPNIYKFLTFIKRYRQFIF